MTKKQPTLGQDLCPHCGKPMYDGQTSYKCKWCGEVHSGCANYHQATPTPLAKRAKPSEPMKGR